MSRYSGFRPEVRHFGFSVNRNRVQCSFKGSCRVKNAGYTIEHAEVGILEFIFTGKRRISRLGGCPRPKCPVTLDFARKSGTSAFPLTATESSVPLKVPVE